jgi:hypothetical protein
MAKIVNVTDVPEFPGAGLLHFDDGRPPLMALPEIADEHRERLSMTAMQDGVAGPGAPDPDAWKTKWGGTLDPHTVPVPPPAAPAPAPAAPPTPPPAQDASGVPPMLARPPEPAPEAAPGTQDIVAAANDAARRQAAEELLYGKATAGSAGRAAGYAPQAQKTVTEQGPAYDTHAAGQRLDAASMVLDAQLAKANTEKQTADAMAARAVAQQAAAQQAAAQQRADILRKQQDHQRQEAALTQELADYSESAKPDPNKFWSTPGGAFSTMLSIIGQGLGAFGSTIGHTENFAFKAAQQKIQLEMAAQEKAYDAGRGDRKNALARLAEHYHGDIDMAKLALQQSLNKVAETETNRFAAQSRSKDISANAALLAAQFQQQQLLSEQQRAELAAGKTTTTVEDKYQTGQAASGPGRKPLTDAERAARLKVTGGGEPGKGQGVDALKPKDLLDESVRYGDKKEDIEKSKHALGELADAYGVKINWETGEVLGADGKPVDPRSVSIPGNGRVVGKLPQVVLSDQGVDVRNIQTRAVSAYLKATSGVAFKPEEVESAKDVQVGRSDADAIRALRRQAAEINALDREHDASHPPEIVEARRERQAQTNADRVNRGKVHPKVIPYAGREDEPEPTE